MVIYLNNKNKHCWRIKQFPSPNNQGNENMMFKKGTGNIKPSDSSIGFGCYVNRMSDPCSWISLSSGQILLL